MNKAIGFQPIKPQRVSTNPRVRHKQVPSYIYDKLVITTNCDREPFYIRVWTKGINMKNIGKMLDPGK